MHKVYNYIDFHGIPEGVVEILGTQYRISVADNLRHSERPAYRGWTNPRFGVWYIQPTRNVFLRVELV